MNEYLVTLDDGRIMTVFAYTRADIATALEDEHGISRENIVRISDGHEWYSPYAYNSPYVDGPHLYL